MFATMLMSVLCAAAPKVEADLLLSPAAAGVVDAAIRLRIEASWHVYWQNPGDSGLPVSVRWILPEGARAEALAWPVPQRYVEGPLATYGYADEVVLTTRLHGMASTDPVQADVRWLACAAACVPGSQMVTGRLDPAAAAAIAESRTRVPREADPAELSVTRVAHSDGILTVVLAGSAVADLREVFPEAVSGAIIDHGAITHADGAIRIPLRGQPATLPLVFATSADPLRCIIPITP